MARGTVAGDQESASAATAAAPAPRAGAARGTGHRISGDAIWGIVFVLPYLAVFLLFVVYPVGYGLWLGSDPRAYAALFADPIYLRTVVNTLLLLIVGVNVKMLLALLLSGFFLL